MQSVALSRGVIRALNVQPVSSRVSGKAGAIELKPSTSYLSLPSAIVAKKHSKTHQVCCSSVDQNDKVTLSKNVALASAAVALQNMAMAAPALAAEVVEDFSDFPYWGTAAAYVGVSFFYLVVGPLATYTWLRERWFVRSKYETVAQFGAVFFFFPGLLLSAPFINFRPALAADRDKKRPM